MRRQAEAAQLFDDQRLGVRQLEPDLGPAVQPTADLDEPRLEGLSIGEEARWVASHHPNLAGRAVAWPRLERVREGSQRARERDAERCETRTPVRAPPSGARGVVVLAAADGFKADEGGSEGGGIHGL